ncbi:MAG: hemolysin family protein, partial [Anaerolineae bacterium]|nr:hemolysin family protein [Anaerolineae bacterium]
APMTRLARLSSPIVSLLNASTNLILKLIRVEPASEPPVTEEEIKIMIAQGARHGVFEPVESEMVEQVFQLGDQRISALITPRNEIVWLDLKASDEEISRIIQDSEHSRYPVAHDSLDDVRGFVFSRDLLSQSLAGQPLDLESILNAALFVPESLPVLKVVDRFKEQQSQIALVIDEYGILQGLVTAYDILQALVGDMPEVGDPIDPHIVQREDGSWLLDGMVSLDVFKDMFDIKEMPDDTNDNHVQTLGGFVMMQMGHIPTAGDHLNWADFRFEVVDMDGHRIDKILVVPDGEEPGE